MLHTDQRTTHLFSMVSWGAAVSAFIISLVSVWAVAKSTMVERRELCSKRGSSWSDSNFELFVEVAVDAKSSS